MNTPARPRKSKPAPIQKADAQAARSFAGPPPQQETEALIGLFGQRRFADAEPIALALTRRHPRYGFGWKALGAVLLAMERHEEAFGPLQKADELLKVDGEVLLKLGNVHRHRGELELAEKCYRRALQIQPAYTEALSNLGVTLGDLDRLAEAEACYRQALSLRPDYTDVHSNLSALYRRQNRVSEAETLSRLALEHQPDRIQHYIDLALTLKAQGRMAEAEAILLRGLPHDPDCLDAHNNLGVVQKEQNKLREAEASFRRVLDLQPEYAVAHNNLGMVFVSQCKLDDAEASFRRALALKSQFAAAHSNLLFALHYNPGVDKGAIFQSHLDWAAAMKEEMAPFPPYVPPTKPAGKPIRLGLVSGSFRRHPVGYMTLGTVPLLAAQGFDLCFFSDTEIEDDFTARFRACATGWHDTRGMDDEALARLIRKEEVDILIDLVGHSKGCRLGAAARRVAPIQVKWVGGLFNTTGLAEMDYLLSDRCETPADEDPWYTEKLVRLPHGYVTYLPPDYAQEPGESPFRRNGYITFGCFNNGAKINAELASMWVRILNAVPHSRLILQYGQFSDASTRDLFSARLAAAGVPLDRVEMRGHSPHRELMRRYQDIDIALDTWPYSGGLTTCEALFMGVPVVSLPGPTFAGRHSCTHLHNVGLADWVVASQEAYVELAVRMAGQPETLSALRAGLRERVLASPLCNHELYAGHLSQALRSMWSRHCAGEAPQAMQDFVAPTRSVPPCREPGLPPYLYYGNLGLHERQFRIPNFVGLALNPQHDREIKHDALNALPFADHSIAKIQSQDVFEHLPFEKLPFVLDEIYRVLVVGGVFRLSVPDYRSPYLKKRSIYDCNSQVIGDLLMGASAAYDAHSGATTVKFTTDGNAHIWFPRYELILELIVKSAIRQCRDIKFYQGFLDDERILCEDIPENEMFVMRSVPSDMRSGGKPVSLVVDFVK